MLARVQATYGPVCQANGRQACALIMAADGTRPLPLRRAQSGPSGPRLHWQIGQWPRTRSAANEASRRSVFTARSESRSFCRQRVPGLILRRQRDRR